jgi:fructose-1,6-bisphosphatase/inositol monophosphatase family enzyme
MENNNLPDGVRAFAEELARAAGELMRGHYRLEYTVEQKSDLTPVTEADHLVNELVIDRVQQMYPEHGVLGEEASHNLGADWLWVCDPIDGTAAYMTRVPTSAFSLALVHDGDVKMAPVRRQQLI